MGNLNNHLRRLIIDGEPIATGVYLIGDSAAITNPQYGRGVSHAVHHAVFVANTILEHSDPREQVLVVDGEVQRMLLPSFLNSIRADRMRTSAWRSAIGLPDRPPATGIQLSALPVDPMKAVAVGASDPHVWIRMNRSGLLLDPPGSWMNDAEIVDRIVCAEETVPSPSMPQSEPDRQIVVEAIVG